MSLLLICKHLIFPIWVANQTAQKIPYTDSVILTGVVKRSSEGVWTVGNYCTSMPRFCNVTVSSCYTKVSLNKNGHYIGIFSLMTSIPSMLLDFKISRAFSQPTLRIFCRFLTFNSITLWRAIKCCSFCNFPSFSLMSFCFCFKRNCLLHSLFFSLRRLTFLFFSNCKIAKHIVVRTSTGI